MEEIVMKNNECCNYGEEVARIVYPTTGTLTFTEVNKDALRAVLKPKIEDYILNGFIDRYKLNKLRNNYIMIRKNAPVPRSISLKSVFYH